MQTFNVVAFVLYLAVGVVQFKATMAGLNECFELHWIIAGPLSLCLAYIPLVGAIAGMLGAIYVWDWTWWQAGPLFIFPLMFAFVALLGVIVRVVAEAATTRRP
jgi:hypothetical protein